MGDEAVLAATANGVGLPGEYLLDASRGPDTERIYAENTARALDAGVFGSPTYFLNGEMFWGQGRIDLLEEAISSGREPYNSLRLECVVLSCLTGRGRNPVVLYNCPAERARCGT